MNTPAPQSAAPSAIILAAGKGTRMNSDLPKVLHPVGDRPMVQWVVDACREAGCRRIVVVIGYEGDRVREALAGERGVEFVEQREQRGTGHAMMMARPAFADSERGDVLVVAGDMPLLRGSTLTSLLEQHRQAGAAASVATGELPDPAGYGRIVRDADGSFLGIVEHKDATAQQRAIREVNPSCYCFRSDRLFDLLDQLGTDNAQGEYYLTDVLKLAREAGDTVLAAKVAGADEVEGINDVSQLQRVDARLRDRAAQGPGKVGGEGAASAGVRV